jgi:hypothetical protein
MGAEESFGERLAKQLRPLVSAKYFIETKRSLLYAISFDDDGGLVLGQNDAKEPTRGGGTGFEQDLLIFERSPKGVTAIVPRVSVELKFGGITTHHAMVYSEKARRIRAIYPYVRYGLILGGINSIPARALRLGTEFDFIVATSERPSRLSVQRIAQLLRAEVHLSRNLIDILQGRSKVALLHKRLKHAKTV